MGKFVDLAGKKFGRLTVLQLSDKRGNRGQIMWDCVCSCGEKTTVMSSNLVSGKSRSCGCSHIEARKRKAIDLTGKVFGRLTVLHRVGVKDRSILWLCKCECGNEVKASCTKLRGGRVASCGCLFMDMVNSYRGKNHPQWNRSLSDEDRAQDRNYPEYRNWRQVVFERDNFTCQKCGKVRGDINAHHIESYNSNKELRTTISNGETLCYECHSDFHHQYGRGNNTREQFNKFMGEEV